MACAPSSGRTCCRPACATAPASYFSRSQLKTRARSRRGWWRPGSPRRCSMLLALDTSTGLASVALYDGAVRAEATWRAGREHSTQVLPGAVRLLEQQRLEPSDLRGVAVAIGPGSYTGVRVGIALAKGLAVALHVPLVGV